MIRYRTKLQPKSRIVLRMEAVRVLHMEIVANVNADGPLRNRDCLIHVLIIIVVERQKHYVLHIPLVSKRR